MCSGSSADCSCRKIRWTIDAKWRFLGVFAFVSSSRTQKSIGRSSTSLVVGSRSGASKSGKAWVMVASSASRCSGSAASKMDSRLRSGSSVSPLTQRDRVRGAISVRCSMRFLVVGSCSNSLTSVRKASQSCSAMVFITYVLHGSLRRFLRACTNVQASLQHIVAH